MPQRPNRPQGNAGGMAQPRRAALDGGRVTPTPRRGTPRAQQPRQNAQYGSDIEREVAEIDQGIRLEGFTSAFAPLTDDQVSAYLNGRGNGQQQRRRQPNRSRQQPQQVPQGQPDGGYATSQPSVEPVIEMSHIGKIYPSQPNTPALEDINIKIMPGEFVFLTGHSGAGKSTFINMILWSEDARPTSGSIKVAGIDLNTLRPKKLPLLRQQIGSVFQDFKLLKDRTVYQNVAFVLECLDKPESFIQKQVPEVLRLVGLSAYADSYPDELSGGEVQRVSIARAMVNRPPLLLCDEPTGNLDPTISAGIMRLLNRINQTGTTIICSTHDNDIVNAMRKRVVAFNNGHIVYDQQNSGYYTGA